MNRRKFFSLLVGLAGLPLLPRRQVSLGRKLYRIPVFAHGEFVNKGQFQAWFKYYASVKSEWELHQIYFHKRTHET